MEEFPREENHKTIEKSQNCIPSPTVKDFSRLGRRYWLWLSDEIEQNLLLFAQKIKRTLTLSKNILKFNPKQNQRKHLKEQVHQHSDLIQASEKRPSTCSQNWTLQRFWIDPHGSNPASWNLRPFHRRRRRLLRLKCGLTTTPRHQI